MIDLSTICSNIQWSEEGLWVLQSKKGVAHESLSYPEDGHDIYFELEEKSFWFAHRNACINSLIPQFSPESLIFDIGGGNGFVSRGMQNAGFEVVLVEPGKRGAINALSRGIKSVICASLQDLSFHDHSLPAACLFDVLEHIKDDLGLLQKIYSLLRPDGTLYLTVPAHNYLWSDEDKIAGHYRRYSLKELSSLLDKAGFDIRYQSYFFSPLWLPILFLRSFVSFWGKTNGA